MKTTSLVRLAWAVGLGGLVLGCTSPEATRARGGGPGADVGNRSEVVQMHEGSHPYWDTPDLIAGFGGSGLEPARQARRLSRRETR